MRKLTTEEFIEKAKATHGNAYNYSSTVYESARKKLTIICPIHGKFEQNPMDHIAGSGCMECSGKTKWTDETFKEKAKVVHSDTYDYSMVKLLNSKTKVEILCLKHGSFWQTPDLHINRKQGCPRCNGGIRDTKETFVSKAIELHGERYSYENACYIDNATKMEINCKVHGAFIQTPNAHIAGQGCPKCGIEKRVKDRKIPLNVFIKRANQVHNNYYSYTNVSYTNIDTKVIIICPYHGEFEQTPYVHLKGHGCSSCALYGFNPDKPAILYYLKITTDDGQILYKIGITNRTINERFSLAELGKIEIVKQKLYENGKDAYDWEQKMLKKYKKYKYKGPKILDSGNTELFTEDVLALYYANIN